MSKCHEVFELMLSTVSAVILSNILLRITAETVKSFNSKNLIALRRSLQTKFESTNNFQLHLGCIFEVWIIAKQYIFNSQLLFLLCNVECKIYTMSFMLNCYQYLRSIFVINTEMMLVVSTLDQTVHSGCIVHVYDLQFSSYLIINLQLSWQQQIKSHANRVILKSTAQILMSTHFQARQNH